jgi:hypothetical protein
MSQAGVANVGAIPPPPGSMTDLQGQDGITVPPNGAGVLFVQGTVVAAGTTPFTTTGNAGTNTETWSIQRTQAAGASAANIAGLASFDSAKFSVDANGFVTTSGTGIGQTITGDTGGALSPTAGNWNILGSSPVAGTNPVRTTGAASTLTINVQKSQAIAATDATKVGLSNFNSAQFTVDANGFVSVVGSAFNTKIGVDAATAPGTNPVLPTAGGQITITGAQVAAGVVGANVIRTDSLAANTLTVEIQRSTAVGASASLNNGVSHFNNTQFTVDANAFVTLKGSTNPAIQGIHPNATSGGGTDPTIADASGNVSILGGTVAAGTNPVRTVATAANSLTTQVQISQAIAATDATKIGLSNFNSANFSVDANGFVSALSQAFNYTSVNFAASPYTVLTTDYYISVDSSGGAVTLRFPNAPTAKQVWIVKDRTGNASTNNITLTTPGGTVTFDGLTSYVMNSNYQAVNLLANSVPGYEIY